MTIAGWQDTPWKYPYDDNFGLLAPRSYFPWASAMWAYELVDPWPANDGRDLSGVGFPAAARPTLDDLLSRMDRPIVKQITLGRTDVNTNGAADELAAGIAFWTLAYQRCIHGLPADDYFALAMGMLSNAKRHGDPVGRSFAALAYAYCLRGDSKLPPWDSVVPTDDAVLGKLIKCKYALLEIYDHYYNIVPARSLQAAKQLGSICQELGQGQESAYWHDIVPKRFPQFSKW